MRWCCRPDSHQRLVLSLHWSNNLLLNCLESLVRATTQECRHRSSMPWFCLFVWLLGEYKEPLTISRGSKEYFSSEIRICHAHSNDVGNRVFVGFNFYRVCAWLSHQNPNICSCIGLLCVSQKQGVGELRKYSYASSKARWCKAASYRVPSWIKYRDLTSWVQCSKLRLLIHLYHCNISNWILWHFQRSFQYDVIQWRISMQKSMFLL